MITLINLAIESIFINNLLLTYFLGMVSYLTYSKDLKTAVHMGLSLTVILTLSSPVNWMIYEFFLAKGALSWIGYSSSNFSFLKFLVFIGTTIGIIHIIQPILKQFRPKLLDFLTPYLPAIMVNSAVLGTTLFMVDRHDSFAQATVFGASSGIGYLFAIVAFAGLQKKLQYANLPKGIEGFPIHMITTGLMTLAFMGFMGLVL